MDLSLQSSFICTARVLVFISTIITGMNSFQMHFKLHLGLHLGFDLRHGLYCSSSQIVGGSGQIPVSLRPGDWLQWDGC